MLEKNTTFPKDAQLHKKIIKASWIIIEDENHAKRQNYKRGVKKLSPAQQFSNAVY